MPYITREDDISVLPLSIRCQNCLRRAQIRTVGAMIDYPDENLLEIRNMGIKSAEEIRHWINVLLNNLDGYSLVEKAELPPSSDKSFQKTAFIDKNGAVTDDIPIDKTDLSVRSKNALKHGGIKFISELIYLTEQELMSFRNMGRKSVDEILNYIAAVEVTYHTNSGSSTTQVPSKYDEIVSELVASFGQSERTWTRELFNVKSTYPEARGETLIYRLYESEFVKATAKAAILNLFEDNGSELSKSSLTERLPQHLSNTTIIEELLLELEMVSAVEIGDVMIVRQYPSVVQFAAQLRNERERQVLEARLAGKTLQEIGDLYGITRERVRQLSMKALRGKPRLREDKYAYIFDNYNFYAEDLLLAFDEGEETYNYLEMISTQSRIRRKPIADLLVDTAVPAALRKQAEKAIYKQYITIDGVRVRKLRADLVKHFIKTLCKTLTKFDDFIDFYHTQLDELGLSDDPTLHIESRTYENKLNGCDYVLWNQWRSFRYYNIPEHDYEDLLVTLNLEEYENTEISSLKLFRDYPDLMAQYDIRDEYELHNLLKKIWRDSNSKVNFGKMPTIEIGSVNRDNQVLDLLLQYAPITGEDFAQKYEETYGIKAGSVLANYMTGFDEYYYDGMYVVSSDNLPNDEFCRMQTILSDDFYPMAEVKRLYTKEFPHSDIASINPYTLKTLGFRVYAGYSGYVVRNTYPSGSAYFHELLTKDDLVDVRSKNRQICYIGTYEKELYDLRAAYEIVEYLPLRYINIRRLNSLGITKESFKDYCSQVAARYEKGEYFTPTSLYQDGFSHAIDDLGFDEWFSSSILIEDRENFSYQRIGGTRILLRGKPNANLSGMLTWLLEQHQKIDFYDLMDLLKDRYGISLPREKLIEIIHGTGLYYDTIMEAVYIDYDTYFEEI